MFKRKFLPVAVVTLVMLVVVAIPIFAASGNSWTDHFTIFHWGNSRTSHGATGEFKLDVTTQLKLDGDYMCGGPSSTHKACPGSHTATCLKVTADSGPVAATEHVVTGMGERVLITTAQGRAILTPVDAISERSRTAGGVKLIDVADGDQVVSVII